MAQILVSNSWLLLLYYRMMGAVAVTNMSRNMYVTGSFQAASATAKKRDESIICVVAWGWPSASRPLARKNMYNVCGARWGS